VAARIDAVLLGYGRFRPMDRLPTYLVLPLVCSPAEDCIGVLIRQKQKLFRISPDNCSRPTPFLSYLFGFNRRYRKNIIDFFYRHSHLYWNFQFDIFYNFNLRSM
jgi:hypothetical protein